MEDVYICMKADESIYSHVSWLAGLFSKQYLLTYFLWPQNTQFSVHNLLRIPPVLSQSQFEFSIVDKQETHTKELEEGQIQNTKYRKRPNYKIQN